MQKEDKGASSDSNEAEDKVESSEVATAVSAVVTAKLGPYLKQHPKEARNIVDKAVVAARDMLWDKGAPKPASHPEGERAGGSAQQGGSRQFPAHHRPIVHHRPAVPQPAAQQPVIHHRPATPQPAAQQPVHHQPAVQRPVVHHRPAAPQPAAPQPAAPQEPDSGRTPPLARSQMLRIGMVAAVIALMVIAPVAVAAIVWLRDVGRASGTEQVPPSHRPDPARPSTDASKPAVELGRHNEALATDPPGGVPGHASGRPPVQKPAAVSRGPHCIAPEPRAPNRASRQPTWPAIAEPALAARPPGTGREPSADEIGKRQVRRAVLNNVDLLRRCYEDQLRINPHLQGKVQVSFVISGEGRVMSSSATGLGDAVDYCVAGEIASISFPSRLDGSGVVVNYPLFFRLAQPTSEARESPTLELGVPTVLQSRIKRPGA
jgi:hypothetical protein